MSKLNKARGSHTIINDKLLITARVLEKAGNLLFGQIGMTVRTYEILIHVHAGENTTIKLASLLQSSLANITHKTKFLESKGYLKRVVNDKDKRMWHFSLTPQGKDVLETIRFLYEKATEKLYAQFSKQQKKQILQFLNDVEKHLKGIVDDKKQVEDFVVPLVKIKK